MYCVTFQRVLFNGSVIMMMMMVDLAMTVMMIILTEESVLLNLSVFTFSFGAVCICRKCKITYYFIAECVLARQ